MPHAPDTNSIKHPALTLTVRTPQCGHTVWGNIYTKPFIHLSLDKTGPFTLESHIHFKSLKCKVPQIIRLQITPLVLISKNSSHTIFEGGTPWVTPILRDIIGWMVPYCAHNFLRWRKMMFLVVSMHFLWDFYGVPLCFLCVFTDIPEGFLCNLYCILFMRFLWNFYGVPMVCL